MKRKIKINSIDTLITAICKTLPPSSKEDLKVINKLKLFIENNTTVDNDTRKTEYTDILFNKTLDISYMRKDFCKEISEEYKKWSNNIISTINSCLNKNVACVEHKTSLIDVDGLEEIKKLNDESNKILNRMNDILIEKKGHFNTEKGIIKYFKAL